MWRNCRLCTFLFILALSFFLSFVSRDLSAIYIQNFLARNTPPSRNKLLIDVRFQYLAKNTKGCQINTSAMHSPSEEFSNASYFSNEMDLSRSHGSRHFLPMPQFNQKNNRLGGVALFHNAFVEGDFSMVFDCSAVYFPGGCRAHIANKAKFDIEKVKQSPSIQSVDTAVLITQFWGEGFYHSMIENLPRLVFVVEFLQKHPSTRIIAYDTLVKERRFLNAILNVSENLRWIRYHSGHIYHVKRLLIPSATLCGSANPTAIRIFQELTASNFRAVPINCSDQEGLKLLLVHKRTSRFLTNHKDLVWALGEKFGKRYQVKEFYGNEPMEHAVALHRAAKVVIGPHGAGLSHAMFMVRNASAIVEIHPKIGNFNGSGVNLCHQRTSKAAGILSRIVVMKSVEVSFGNPYPVENISLVLQTVEEVINILRGRNDL